MIQVERQDSLHLKVSRVLQEETSHRLDLFLFVPGELGLTGQVIPEEDFYHGSIHVKRTYFSDRYRLPLVLSRLAERGKLDAEHYRLSLSLYAYQYVVAMESAIQPLIDDVRRARKNEKVEKAEREREEEQGREDDSTASEQGDQPQKAPENEQLAELEKRLAEHVDLAVSILSRLRRQEPSDESLHRYFATIDNYLSWFTEQRLLALLAGLPRGARFRPIRARLVDICRAEDAYRREREYNSARVTRDPTRMSNKMRLLRRLIEHPVTLKQKNQELGNAEQKAVKALATAVVMIFVSLGLLEIRTVLADLTALFVLAMAGIYALREVFKDDLRNTLWRLLRRGRPKWRRQYLDPTRDQVVGRQLEWFDYKRFSRLDDEIKRVRKRSVAQREEVVVHYRSSSRMSPTRFLSGYDHTRESLTLDLSPIARLMDKSSRRVYRLGEGDQVVREEVEKRHLLNLVIRETQGSAPATLERWKIVMSRSRIVDVERVHGEGPGHEEAPDPS
ncbi:hypothetical protein [Halomonas icarae]|uniref:Uncharacterized protein n=1 Tax=Halomonas icarae TaxID=2691040 RepID=A0A7X5AKF4_9GAMM|nr:hypothetical protein [Halomonas icarae]MDR5900960.1 hypothetical protein [Halomonas icarae]NAW11235.1 hypothetical protein [Halomonas icarae]